ncbi:MAG: Rrf2 family transcriptional regulator [Lentimicrobiaceae bacterium]|jgi:Rrf2 family protein|nr:Rrf2 family transcriptional regulator [Lentimicrobiaceae bacterium]
MLSKRTRYTILALSKLAIDFGRGPILIGDIARSEHIPQRFLELILLDLKKLGYVGSKLGKKGGYFLLRNPFDIRMSEIMRDFEGPIALLPCVSEKYYQPCEHCKDETVCGIKKMFRKIRDNTYEMFNNTTLGEISGKQV